MNFYTRSYGISGSIWNSTIPVFRKAAAPATA